MTLLHRDGPASTGRRAVTLLTVLLTVLFAVLFGFATPASAHGGVDLTIHGDGRGSVWVTAVWADGHPITEGAGALITATAGDGQRVGPAPLKVTGDALTYTGSLPPGQWTVVAEMGSPAIARCQAAMKVVPEGATPTPTEVRCAAPPAAPPPPSASFPWLVVVTVAIFVAGVAVLAWAYLRTGPRRRPHRPGAR